MLLEAHITHSSKELRFEPKSVRPQNSGSLCTCIEAEKFRVGRGGRGWSPMAVAGRSWILGQTVL